MQIGYARVSTEEQNLHLQLDALKSEQCDKILTDEGVSGSIITRPGLDGVLKIMQSGDVLTVWKLDRLGRSLHHLISILEALQSKGCGFKSLSENIDTTTASGKFFFHIIGAFAELERSLISERTKAGLQAAKKRGQTLGRPRRLTDAQINHARQNIKSGQESEASMAKLYGVDRSTLHRALKR